MRQLGMLTAFAVALAALPAMGQTRVWSVEFGSSEYDSPFDMLADGEGGVYVAGVTDGVMGGGEPRQDWLARFDAEGAQRWMVGIESLGLFFNAGFPTLASAGDRGVYVRSSPSVFGDTVSLYTKDGMPRWSEEIWWHAEGIVPVSEPDQGFCLVGQAGSVRVTRHDGLGEELWSTDLPYLGLDEVSGWATSSDGHDGVLLAGITYLPITGPITGDYDTFSARVDSTGAVAWITQWSDWEWITSLRLVVDSYFQTGIAGRTEIGLVGRFNLDGTARWVIEIDSPAHLEAMIDVLPMSDGGVVAILQRVPDLRPSWSEDYTSLLVRLDAGGRVLWMRDMDRSSALTAVRLASDGVGGAFVTGWRGGLLGEPQTYAAIEAFLARYSLCLPDLTTSALIWHPNYGVPDGVVSTDDFFYYLSQFAPGNVAVCDLTHGAVLGEAEYGTPDGVVSNDDFFYYLQFYARGC